MSTYVHVPAATITGPLEPSGQRPGADSGDPQLGILRFETDGAVRAGVWECEPGGGQWRAVRKPRPATS